MVNIIKLLRPQQWVKNLFIFVPLFFSGNFTNETLLYRALIAFVSFCLVASAIYILNDICDLKADRLHPIKCKRPIASGEVNLKTAVIIALLLVGLSYFILFIFEQETRLLLIKCVSSYLIMNIGYCIYLKHKALIDIFVIALGFVLRIVIGGCATNIWISHWLILMTFLLALFLALAKRRDDVLIYEHTGKKMRKNIFRYNLSFINQSITMIASINIICYILYTVSPDVISRMNSEYVYVTSVFVLLGVLRYMQLAIVDEKSGSPTKVLVRDSFLQICIVCWVALFLLIIYF